MGFHIHAVQCAVTAAHPLILLQVVIGTAWITIARQIAMCYALHLLLVLLYCYVQSNLLLNAARAQSTAELEVKNVSNY